MLGEEGIDRARVVLRGLARRQHGVVAIADDHGDRVGILFRRRQRAVKLANSRVGFQRIARAAAVALELARRRRAKLQIAGAFDAPHIVEREMAVDRHAGAAPGDAVLGLQLVELALAESARRRQAGRRAAIDHDAGPMRAAQQSDQIFRQAVDIETRAFILGHVLFA